LWSECESHPSSPGIPVSFSYPKFPLCYTYFFGCIRL
jgi:hypothetical protein